MPEKTDSPFRERSAMTAPSLPSANLKRTSEEGKDLLHEESRVFRDQFLQEREGPGVGRIDLGRLGVGPRGAHDVALASKADAEVLERVRTRRIDLYRGTAKLFPLLISLFGIEAVAEVVVEKIGDELLARLQFQPLGVVSDRTRELFLLLGDLPQPHVEKGRLFGVVAMVYGEIDHHSRQVAAAVPVVKDRQLIQMVREIAVLARLFQPRQKAFFLVLVGRRNRFRQSQSSFFLDHGQPSSRWIQEQAVCQGENQAFRGKSGLQTAVFWKRMP